MVEVYHRYPKLKIYLQSERKRLSLVIYFMQIIWYKIWSLSKLKGILQMIHVIILLFIINEFNY